MKSIKYIVGVVLAMVLASCTTDKDREPALPETNPIQAYVYSDTETSVTFTPDDEQSFEVQIGRRVTTDAAELPIEVMDEDSTIWRDTVYFEAGEASSTLTIETDLELEESEDLTILIPDEYKTAYGPQSMTITVSMDYTWLYAGTADMISTWEGAEADVDVQRAKEYSDSLGNTLYRLESPYYFLAPSWCTAPGKHVKFLLDKDKNAVDLYGGPEIDVEDDYWWIWDPETYTEEFFSNTDNDYLLSVIWTYGDPTDLASSDEEWVITWDE